jgi:hypothetical protein
MRGHDRFRIRRHDGIDGVHDLLFQGATGTVPSVSSVGIGQAVLGIDRCQSGLPRFSVPGWFQIRVHQRLRQPLKQEKS